MTYQQRPEHLLPPPPHLIPPGTMTSVSGHFDRSFPHRDLDTVRLRPLEPGPLMSPGTPVDHTMFLTRMHNSMPGRISSIGETLPSTFYSPDTFHQSTPMSPFGVVSDLITPTPVSSHSSVFVNRQFVKVRRQEVSSIPSTLPHSFSSFSFYHLPLLPKISNFNQGSSAPSLNQRHPTTESALEVVPSKLPKIDSIVTQNSTQTAYIKLGTTSDYFRAKEYTSELGLKSYKEWKNYIKVHHLPDYVPVNPAKVFRKDWISWPVFLGVSTCKNRNKSSSRFLVYEEARKFVQQFNIRTQRDWWRFCTDGRRPSNVPGDPSRVYAGRGWKGWSHWFFQSA